MRWLILLLLISGCTAKTYSENENHRGNTQSTYDVWEYDIVSAYEMAGKRLRIAVVNERRFIEPVLDAEGSDGLSETNRKDIPVGTTKRLVLRDFQLKSIHSPMRYDIRALKDSDGVVVNVTHLRSCPVTTSERESTSIVGDSSKGIITVPKLKTVVLREFTTPPCADPSDKQIELGAAKTGAGARAATPSPEVRAALEQTEKEKAEEDFKKRLSHRLIELEREFNKKARTVSFDEKLDKKTDLEQALCPRLSGLMQAAGIGEIRLAHIEAFRKEHKGYTEVRYESSATLLPMNDKFTDSDLSQAARLIRSVKPDSRGCVEVQFAPSGSSASSEDLRKIAKELESLVIRHQRSVDYDRAMKELGR
jgi:hypothetical protein